jgi:extracellular matrix regulatory protein B
MYIHVGGEYTVSDKYIVGIFDFDGTTVKDSDTIRFLKSAESKGNLEVVSPELPRSFVVTLDRVYVTPISAVTLRKRFDRPDGSEDEYKRIRKMTWDLDKTGHGNNEQVNK